MASRINADSSNGLQLVSDSSGEIQFQSSGITKATIGSNGLSSPGHVIQVVSTTSNAVTISTSTPTPIISLNITTTGSSKLYCAFSSDLNSDTTGAWKWNGLQVDGTWITKNISSTADAGFQSCISLVGLSTTLSAGSHTVLVAGWNGTGTSTYAEGNDDGNSLVVMEVAT